MGHDVRLLTSETPNPAFHKVVAVKADSNGKTPVDAPELCEDKNRRGQSERVDTRPRYGCVISDDLRFIGEVISQAAERRDIEQEAREKTQGEQAKRISASYMRLLVCENCGELRLRQFSAKRLRYVNARSQPTGGKGGHRQLVDDPHILSRDARCVRGICERVTGFRYATRQPAQGPASSGCRANSINHGVCDANDQQHMETGMDGSQQLVQRNQADVQQVVTAGQRFTEARRQVMPKYRACPEHQERGDTEQHGPPV